jgi:hypothetical protein
MPSSLDIECTLAVMRCDGSLAIDPDIGCHPKGAWTHSSLTIVVVKVELT